MKLAANTNLDDALYKWFTQKRAQGEPISGPILCEKAVQFNEKLEGPSNFQASTGWLKRFKSRHGIRELQIQGEKLSAKKKDSETNIPLPDQRGKHVSGNKIKDEDKAFVKQHIDSFPRFVSHYGERFSNRQYLEPNLNLQKMYSCYVEKCRSVRKEPVKKSYYRTIFNTYNLHFYIPKKDTCKTCDILSIKIQNEHDIEKCLQIKSNQKNIIF